MYHGDINLGETHDFKFTTRRFSTGAPFTLAGTPAVAAYPSNSTTEITAGITLTVDFDLRTGLHNVRVVATAANGYATATNYTLVLTAGTVDAVSVVGECIGSFSIENRVINRAKFHADTGLQSIRSNTAQAGGASTITLDTGASGTNNFYNGTGILLTGGTGAGQFRIITAYVGATKVATVDVAWVTNPVGSDTTFAIFPTAATKEEVATAVWAAATRSLTSGTVVAAAVWDKLRTDHVISGSFGKLADAIWDEALAGHVTAGSSGERLGRIPNVAAGGTNGLFIAGTNAATTITTALSTTFTGNLTGTVGGNVTGSVGSVTGNVGGNVVGSIGSLAAQAKTDVNAEVLDVLVTDNFAEPSAVPAATSSLKDKINWLFMLGRNKITQTATTTTVRNAADSATIATSTVSDDNTTATRGGYS